MTEEEVQFTMAFLSGLSAIIVFLFILVFGFLLRKWGQSFLPPHLLFSSVDNLKRAPHGKSPIYSLYAFLGFGALILFSLAFFEPVLFFKRVKEEPIFSEEQAKEGIAFYLVLDRSGSMGEPADSYSMKKISSKLDFSKEVMRDFVEGNPHFNLAGRPSDLIGLAMFARTTQILSPLTLDHKEIVKQLSEIQVVKKRQEDGTAIGYAIYKTAHFLVTMRHYLEKFSTNYDSPYRMKKAAVVLVTDGFQAPNPLDTGRRLRTIGLEEAARYAKKEGITLFLINVDPRIGLPEFEAHRNLMERITRLTGGKFYFVRKSSDLIKVYEEIDRIERSILPDRPPSKPLYTTFSFSLYLVVLAMLFLFGAIYIETVIIRRFP